MASGSIKLVRDGAGYYRLYTHDDGTVDATLIYVPASYQEETISLRSDIASIASGAFAHSPIRHIEIPATVHTIETHAFYECPNLETVTIAAGSRMRRIYASIFLSCPSVSRVDLSSVSPDLDLRDDFDNLSTPVQIIYPGENPSATPITSTQVCLHILF